MLKPAPTAGRFDSTRLHEAVRSNGGVLREGRFARADAVPEEIVRETKAIRDRYREITPRLFPVAVSYVVPERLVR